MTPSVLATATRVTRRSGGRPSAAQARPAVREQMVIEAIEPRVLLSAEALIVPALRALARSWMRYDAAIPEAAL